MTARAVVDRRDGAQLETLTPPREQQHKHAPNGAGLSAMAMVPQSPAEVAFWRTVAAIAQRMAAEKQEAARRYDHAASAMAPAGTGASSQDWRLDHGPTMFDIRTHTSR